MSVLKRVVTGKYSLAVTVWGFWLFLELCNSAVFLLMKSSDAIPIKTQLFLIFFLFIFKTSYSIAIITGVFHMLKSKVTIWRVVVILLLSVQIICLIIAMINWCMVALPDIINYQIYEESTKSLFQWQAII
ncbi:hypothetical protein QVM86_00680 [Providencia stuartii]|nr:hypothetical protein [Providencia stuartii]